MALAGVACSEVSEVAPPSKVVVLLLDRSQSTNREDAASAYGRTLGAVFGSLTHGDALVAAWITDRSGAELELAAHHEFPPLSPTTDNPLMLRRYRRRAAEELEGSLTGARRALDAALADASRRVMRTDILSSLELAERVLGSMPQGRKILVVLSDMVEDSAAYNFEREPLSDERIAAILATLRETRRLPDLGGVRVHVVGASHRSLERQRWIRDFWMAFFAAAGAELRSQDYGGPLIRFDA